MALPAVPAATAPHTSDIPARGSTRRDTIAGTSTMTLPRAYTRSAVSCGRAVWPPGPGQDDVDRVAGGGDGPDAQADVARAQTRVAVQREDRRDVVDGADLDRFQRTAGHLFLGRLEDQPHPAGQVTGRDQRGRGADQRRGVDVVAAGVADADVARTVGHVLGVEDRQRVDVRPQRHRPIARADVAQHPGAAGEVARRQAEPAQVLGDLLRRAVLLVTQLGVRVQVAAELDQLGFVIPEVAVHGAGEFGGNGGHVARRISRSCYARISTARAGAVTRRCHPTALPLID